MWWCYMEAHGSSAPPEACKVHAQGRLLIGQGAAGARCSRCVQVGFGGCSGCCRRPRACKTEHSVS